MSWTDIDESASFGGVYKGTSWGRPNDRIGLAGIINGISSNYQAFLAAGGLGINIGDGALSYRPEEIMRLIIRSPHRLAAMTFDYQFMPSRLQLRARPGSRSAPCGCMSILSAFAVGSFAD